MAAANSILYSLVSRGTVVLCEATSGGTSGNFDTVTRLILEKIDTNENSKRSYVYNRHIFHYVVQDGLIFLCMADEQLSRRIPFAFLADIIKRWTSTYADRGLNAMAYGMNEEFSKVLMKQMDYFSNDPNADKINRVKGELDEVKTIMVTNIEKVLERGERIELLVDKTDNLSNQAFQFKRKSTALKRSMWWKNCKLWLLLIFIVLIIIFVISVIACGGLTFKRCRKQPSNNNNGNGNSSSNGGGENGGKKLF